MSALTLEIRVETVITKCKSLNWLQFAIIFIFLFVWQDQNLPYASSNEIIIPCDDNSTLVWLQKQIEAVIILSMEDKPFSDVEIEEETA